MSPPLIGNNERMGGYYISLSQRTIGLMKNAAIKVVPHPGKEILF
jgi:hypothetical protein